ncbi:beta-ketoacyl synthase N-terminal-like domain-containing protein, partial [Streptomyces sp. NPDC005917]|uniref:beta-ketoacyl-[acyl-carrier-protein] synthase family protein n=1 Tax=Streptomyces sp. NPDC005917 TaxID=3155347 RepID=UPI0033FD683E
MKRVVITGMGVVAPGGVGAKAFWELLSGGRTATRDITLFDAAPFRSRIAAEADFDPAEHGFAPVEAERLDRAAQFALVATREALADSGVHEALDPLRTGVSLGSAVGCTTGLDTEYAVVSDRGRDWTVDHTRAVAHLFDYFVPSSLAAEVARTAGAQGPVSLVPNGCTSGLDAIGYAAELIREGSADVMLAGATDAPISPITVACFDAIKATSPRNDAPATASRPFDRTRDGFVQGAVRHLVARRAARARPRPGPRRTARRLTAVRPADRGPAPPPPGGGTAPRFPVTRGPGPPEPAPHN